MRKVLIAILIIPTTLFGQKSKFDFPRNNMGKIEYDSRPFTFERNFKMSVKTSLSNYADYFNGAITFGSAKMHDYIAYEDDSTLVASLKFYVKQALRLNVFSGEIEFDKINNNQYTFKITKLRLLQVYNTWSDYPQQNVVIDMDGFNVQTHQPLCVHLDQEIEHFTTFIEE